MVMVRPFRGIRYNPESISSFDAVLAPPYDVISPLERDELYEKSPHNVIRLILSREEGDAKYETAAKTFREWLAQNILMQDDEPAIYPYYQEFEDEGKQYIRKGFMAVVRLEDFKSKKVLPHEQTFDKPKADRLKLTKAAKANLSSIFAIYSDSEGTIEQKIDECVQNISPIAEVHGGDGARNKFWKLNDPELFELISGVLESESILIADGHHRYETALNYRDELREGQDGGDTEEHTERNSDYVMMYLSRAESAGLLIKPTHRVVTNPGSVSPEVLIKAAEADFDITKEASENSVNSLAYNEFCLLTSGDGELYRFTPKRALPDSYNNLAVMQLHSRILGELIEEDAAEVVYTKSLQDAKEILAQNKGSYAFLLPPSKPSEIFDVTLSGLKMPHKTTYFFPKILSGMVFHLLD